MLQDAPAALGWAAIRELERGLLMMIETGIEDARRGPGLTRRAECFSSAAAAVQVISL